MSGECFFVSDLHGDIDRYVKLFRAVKNGKPRAVFLGGDLLPSGLHRLVSMEIDHRDFINDFLAKALMDLKSDMLESYPDVFVILGNDDSRFEEASVLDVAGRGLWKYMHNRKYRLDDIFIYGYAFVPPTPFQLKDWERYDISRYVDPGCLHPEDGMLSVPVAKDELRFATIKEGLEALAGSDDVRNAVFLFHSPPYKTNLDRAALDGKMIDFVPVDVHVGSIAIRRFIETRQPRVTLHGHVHESARLTGSWRDRIGETHAFSAAHDGHELALIRFSPDAPENAVRELI